MNVKQKKHEEIRLLLRPNSRVFRTLSQKLSQTDVYQTLNLNGYSASWKGIELLSKRFVIKPKRKLTLSPMINEKLFATKGREEGMNAFLWQLANTSAILSANAT